MTGQQARDKKARIVAGEIKKRGLSRDKIVEVLSRYANDPDELHFTPHLITAVREAGVWPTGAAL